MTQEQRTRYLELQKRLQLARQIKSKAREEKNVELDRDADSKINHCNGAINEMEFWFGKFDL